MQAQGADDQPLASPLLSGPPSATAALVVTSKVTARPDLEPFCRRKKLTGSLISKQILSPIACGGEPPRALVRALGLEDSVATLRRIHQAYRGEWSESYPAPKYLPFYRFIASRLPDFRWRVRSVAGQPITHIQAPYVHYAQPSLLTLLICALHGHADVVPLLKVRYPQTRALPDSVARDLQRLLETHPFARPYEAQMTMLVRLIQRGLAGEPITLVAPVCPDYGYKKVGNRYRYTFSRLGSGVGLVASRVVKTLPALYWQLRQWGVAASVVVAAGDFEAADTQTLARLHETRASFLDKLARSQERILQAMACPARAIFVTDLADGRDWLRLVRESRTRIQASPELQAAVPAILSARRPLYRAWFGDWPTNDHGEILLRQGAEYASMAKLFAENFDTPLVIGADHRCMLPFYWTFGALPVLYLKAAY